MTFARRVFRCAGIYGLIVLPPQYFLEARIGQDAPPPITHPEFFYGFLGVAIAWQVAFLIIAQDPPRYRPLMLAGVIEKFSFAAAVATLFAQGRAAVAVMMFAGIDLVLGVLFLAAWLQCCLPAESHPKVGP
jgi:hypothetical protein